MAVQAGLEIERAEELDRRAEGEKGIDWKSVMENADGEDETEIYEGIEEERRRWLVYTRLKWPTPGGETEMLDRTEEFALATSRVSSHVTCTASAISGA